MPRRLQPHARRVPGAAGTGGARALRVLRQARGGRLGGLLAGLGFMLPGFLLMLGSRSLYSRPIPWSRPRSSTAAGGGRRLIVRAWSRSVIVDEDAAVGGSPARRCSRSSLGVTSCWSCCAGLAYELWTTPGAGRGRLDRVDRGPGCVCRCRRGHALLRRDLPEGLKTGLFTFGGAYTAVPFLHESAVRTTTG